MIQFSAINVHKSNIAPSFKGKEDNSYQTQSATRIAASPEESLLKLAGNFTTKYFGQKIGDFLNKVFAYTFIFAALNKGFAVKSNKVFSFIGEKVSQSKIAQKIRPSIVKTNDKIVKMASSTAEKVDNFFNSQGSTQKAYDFVKNTVKEGLSCAGIKTKTVSEASTSLLLGTVAYNITPKTQALIISEAEKLEKQEREEQIKSKVKPEIISEETKATEAIKNETMEEEPTEEKPTVSDNEEAEPDTISDDGTISLAEYRKSKQEKTPQTEEIPIIEEAV